MAQLTKEGVLGNVAIDLILKGEKLESKGHHKTAMAFFEMAGKVVKQPQKVTPTINPESPNK